MTKKNTIYLILHFKIILFFFMQVASVHSKDESVTLWTTHPQVSYDLQEISNLYAPAGSGERRPFDSRPIFGEQNNADIHQFKPNSNQLKKLIKYTPIIAGPASHQPWVELARRSSLLNTNSTHFLNLSLGNDHYWLSASKAKAFELRIQAILNQLKLSNNKELLWSKSIENDAIKINSFLNQKAITKIVLSHNALVPLFKGSPNIETLVLYNDDHHSEVSAHNIKKVYNWAKNPEKMLFIYEKSITWPAPLKNRRFDKVYKIKWSPIGHGPLHELLKALEALK